MASQHGCTHPRILCFALSAVLVEGWVPSGVTLGGWLDGWYSGRDLTEDDAWVVVNLVVELAKERPDLYPEEMSPLVPVSFVVTCNATQPGEDVAIVYGPDWNVYSAILLDGSDFPIWRGEKKFLRGLDLAFKVVILRNHSSEIPDTAPRLLTSSWMHGKYVSRHRYVDWERGTNRRFSEHREGKVIVLEAHARSFEHC